MTRMDVTLDVALKGADLFASTAALTLRDKMGLEDEVIGVARLDRYRFVIETPGDPEETLAAVEGVFDRRSTFYNRNKHEYALTARLNGATRFRTSVTGAGTGALRSRWVRSLGRGEMLILELTVHDDDDERVAALGAKVQDDLRRVGGLADTKVSCHEASTVWWLALSAGDPEEAREVARRIALTRSRDEGLLANPAYQRVDLGAACTPANFVESAG